MVVHIAMLDYLKNPPQGFEDIIKTHFRLKARYLRKQLDKWLEEDDGKPLYADSMSSATAYTPPSSLSTAVAAATSTVTVAASGGVTNGGAGSTAAASASGASTPVTTTATAAAASTPASKPTSAFAKDIEEVKKLLDKSETEA